METVQEVSNSQPVPNRIPFVKFMVLVSIASVLLSITTGIITSIIINAHISSSYVPRTIYTSSETTNVKTVSQESAVTTAVQSANPAVVSITVSQNTSSLPPFFNQGNQIVPVAKGSGFVIRSDGYILTNKHVAPDTSYTYTVTFADGKTYQAHILYHDPNNDIAILKINATNLTALPLADTSSLQLGESVIAIGNALGQYQNTVDVGVVSGLNRTVTAGDQNGTSSETLKGIIQTDAQINSGNSGGPLLNIAGQVIGINTAVAQNAQGIGFAIPITQAKTDITKAESGLINATSSQQFNSTI